MGSGARERQEMLMKKLMVSTLAAACAVVLTANGASAAAWVPSSGTVGGYNYSNGMDTDGHFGSPTSITDGHFQFEPSSFRSISVGNDEDLVTDTLKVNISTANGQKTINKVRLEELGDYVIDNVGSVKAFAGLFVRVLDADWSFSTRTYTADFTSLPGFPVTGDAQGNWSGGVVVNLPANARSISITINNTLQSHSSAGGSALIQKKEVDIVLNPEPATFAALFGGFGFLAARRRKA